MDSYTDWCVDVLEEQHHIECKIKENTLLTLLN